MVKANGFFVVPVSLSVLCAVLVLIYYAGTYADKDKQNSGNTIVEQVPLSISLPDTLSLAGEKIPLHYYDVREALDRELLVNTYWHSNTILYIKRAHRFFPVIEPILKEEGVPDDFKYLAVAESGLTNALSPSDAAGFWQFLKGTGKEYNLEVNDQVDERYHLEKSTRAACKYLKDSYTIFGSWAMAAASYNTGRTNMNKHIGRQKSNDYYDLYLHEETARYLFRIAAIKLVLENPERYQFFIKDSEKYKPLKFTTIDVDSSITDVANFAEKNGTSYKMIKLFNPWLRDNYFNNPSKKVYSIKIPEKGFREEI